MALLSINQLAEFSKATIKGKQNIVKQQISPNRFLIQWYQLARARIKKSISNGWDLQPIYSGLQKLKSRISFKNPRQENDQKVSIKALENFLQISKPRELQSMTYEQVVPESKILVLGNLQILVAPDVIFRTQIDGKNYLGAFKIHICMTKPFDLSQSRLVAAVLWKYLEREVAREGEVALPNLSFCYDVFSNRIVYAQEDSNSLFYNIDLWGHEVNQIWDSLRQTG